MTGTIGDFGDDYDDDNDLDHGELHDSTEVAIY